MNSFSRKGIALSKKDALNSAAVIFFALSLCTALIFACHSSAQARFIIKFATVAPEGSTWMKHMRELQKKLKVESKGQIGFRIYPGGVAGDELDVLRKIRIRQIHCAAFTGVGLGQILPMARVMDLPFLFRNYKEVDLVRKKLEPFFETHFKEKGFDLLALAEVGDVHIFSKKPVRRVSDLSKLRVWIWSGDPIAKETFSSMGVSPVPLAITDVNTALSTGMIDTVYVPPLGALTLQWYPYLKFMMSLPLAYSTGAVLISRSFSSRMTTDLFNLLKKDFHQTMAELTEDLRAQNKETIHLLEEKGLKVLPMPAGPDLRDFYTVRDKVAKALSGKVYPAELLERVNLILNSERREKP